MRSTTYHFSTITTVLVLSTLLTTQVALSCPFCSAPSLTLTEQLDASQVTALVQWTGGKESNRDEGFTGTTDYKIVKIERDESNTLAVDQTVTLDRFRPGKEGDLFLLLGTVIEEKIEWGSPLEVTETSYNYMTQAPSKETPTVERIQYFIKFLEYPDTLIATDAYGEFANAPYEDIVPLAPLMPREKLREWLNDPQVTPTRNGLFGLMLGLCGKEEDAEFLKLKIMEPTEDFRLGIDGVMSGYLLLTGAEGLDLIDAEKLSNRKVPFSETFAAMQALRFMWTYSPERIAPERLRDSMELLLERPNLSDLVIVDLARWEDWDIMDSLMTLYDREEYDVPSIKRAIVRFLLIAEKDTPAKEASAESDQPQHVVKAKEYLAQLKERDPEIVEKAKRYFFD